MASTRLSLRAAIILAIFALGEVSAVHHDNGASPKKHRKVKRGHGRCSHHTSSSVPSVSLVLSTSSSSSTTVEDIATSSTEPSSLQSSSIPSSSLSILTSILLSASTPEDSLTSTPVPSTASLSSSTFTSILLSTSAPGPSSASPSSSSSWLLPSSTSAVPSSSEIPLSSTTSSSTVASSTTSICEPTVTTWAPELCWRSIPNRCNSMTITTAPSATLSAHISACTSALRGFDNQLVPEVSGCFENIGQPAFAPPSAWSCIASASIFCSSTIACAPSSTSQPIIPPYDNGSFESGSFGSWTLTPPATPDSIIGSISTEQAHSGSHSLKLQSSNLADDFASWSHRVRFEPNGRYEFAFWYYSTSNLSRGTLSLRVEYPGTSVPLVIQMTSQPTARWIQQKFSLTPAASFGTISVGYLSTRLTTGSNVVYIDDVTVTKVQ